MNRKIIVLLGIILSMTIMIVGCTNLQVSDEKTNENFTEVEHTSKESGENKDKSENDVIVESNGEKENNVIVEPNGEKENNVIDETIDENENNIVDEKENEAKDENAQLEDKENKNPIATMTMKNGDIIKMELYPDIAPETVKNFISLANSGFYDGLVFHRVIPSFMAQGGDPKGNGTGGPGYSIKGEFKLNGVENDLTHDIGVVSMARSTEYDSAGSQFFIVTDDEYSKESLDGQYAGFGKVIEGMDYVYAIVNSEVIRRDIDAEIINKVNNEFYTTGQVSAETYDEYYVQMMEVDRPKNPPVIKTITVETFGVEYGEPTKY